MHYPRPLRVLDYDLSCVDAVALDYQQCCLDEVLAPHVCGGNVVHVMGVDSMLGFLWDFVHG